MEVRIDGQEVSRGKRERIHRNAKLETIRGIGGDFEAISNRGIPVRGMGVDRGAVGIDSEHIPIAVGQEPVPVEHSHITGDAGTGMPSQEMVMMIADFANPILMANIVIIRLRQRSVNQAEDQSDDPRQAVATMHWYTPAMHFGLGDFEIQVSKHSLSIAQGLRSVKSGERNGSTIPNAAKPHHCVEEKFLAFSLGTRTK